VVGFELPKLATRVQTPADAIGDSMDMEKNMSSLESGARIIVGIILALVYVGAFGLPDLGVFKWLALLFAVVFIVTGVLQYCPVYTLLKQKPEKAAKGKK
jgi:hypothetical protein